MSQLTQITAPRSAPRQRLFRALDQRLCTPFGAATLGFIFLASAFWRSVWRLHSTGHANLLAWDTNWYRSIAVEGYSFSGDYTQHSNIAFFPLFPFVARAVSFITGMTPVAALYTVSAVSAFFSLVFIFKIAAKITSPTGALLAVLLFVANPLAFYLMTGHTEALFLCLTVASLYLAIDKRFWLSAICAGACTAVRHTGVLALGPIMLAYLLVGFDAYKNHQPLPQLLAKACGIALLSVSGIVLYMTYLYVAYNDPIAFLHAQKAWYGAHPPGSFSVEKFLGFANLRGELNHIASSPHTLQNVGSLSLNGVFYATVQWLLLPIALLLGLYFLPISLWFFMALVPLFYHLATHSHPQGMGSMGRYQLVNFLTAISYSAFIVHMWHSDRISPRLRLFGRWALGLLIMAVLLVGWFAQKFLVRNFLQDVWVS